MYFILYEKLGFLGSLDHFGVFVHFHKNLKKYFHIFKKKFEIGRTLATRWCVNKVGFGKTLI